MQTEVDIFKALNNESDYVVKYYGHKQTEKHVTMKLERCDADLLKFRKNY